MTKPIKVDHPQDLIFLIATAEINRQGFPVAPSHHVSLNNAYCYYASGQQLLTNYTTIEAPDKQVAKALLASTDSTWTMTTLKRICCATDNMGQQQWAHKHTHTHTLIHTNTQTIYAYVCMDVRIDVLSISSLAKQTFTKDNNLVHNVLWSKLWQSVCNVLWTARIYCTCSTYECVHTLHYIWAKLLFR